ncbi:MAG: molybdenum cofactor guanylyltransferase [Candidatus Latescibacteria bacterium]|jgi:molybdopterin-guanine dinucleotide biosynthesis protein A|nr:molybdenum cofactor guanylyltransferase [Candidatus Latescibacterota bacterium]
MKYSGLILVGGRSKRMGRPKAWLPFGNESLLQRIVHALSGVVSPIVLVAESGQVLPDVKGVEILYDPIPDQGPLMGLATGLKALQPVSKWAFVTGCDAPFLTSKLISLLFSGRRDAEIVAPHIEGQSYPLTALYNTDIWQKAQTLLDSNVHRLMDLLDLCRVREISDAELRAIDPDLLTLMNVNTPELYEKALALDSGNGKGNDPQQKYNYPS